MALESLRTRLIDVLHALIPAAKPAERRFLLAVKRDCFNQRSLIRHQKSPYISLLPADLWSSALLREEELEILAKSLEQEFVAQLLLEMRQLLALSVENDFLRGLSLSSLSLADGLPRLQPRSTPDRKERGAFVSLLRFISRAALKTSPFSTLTRVAFGKQSSEILGRRAGRGVHLGASRTRGRSLARLNLPQHQYLCLLERVPALRAGLGVVRNGTAVSIGADAYRLLRPSRWRLVEGETEQPAVLRFETQKRVTVRLKGELIRWLEATPMGRESTYRELVVLAAREFPDREAASLSRQIDDLIEVGYLLLRPPWPTHDCHFERRLYEYLRSLTAEPEPELAALGENLSSILAAEEGFAKTASAVGAIRSIEGHQRRLWRGLASLSTGDPALEGGGVGDPCFYEDVLVDSEDGSSLFDVSSRVENELLRDAHHIYRFFSLFQRRWEMLHALDAHAAECFPRRKEVSLLEIFDSVKEHWQAFLSATRKEERGLPAEVFDPYGLEDVASLARLQREIWEEMPRDCFDREPEGLAISKSRLEKLLARIPQIYAPIGGACLFVQPADAEGKGWVLNRIFEGTGRYSSRFSKGLADTDLEDYVAFMRARSCWIVDGEEADLVDVLTSFGSSLNVHPIQTERVLELPGERIDLPPARRLGLEDLQVVFRQGRLPALSDQQGRRVIPVHLGHVRHQFLPSMLRFLHLFGPSGLQQKWPAVEPRSRADVRVYDRLRIGSLILRRQRWIFPIASLRQRIELRSDADAFSELDAWRREIGLPERVFFVELVKAHYGQTYKPQYFDFTSPLFLLLLRSLLKSQPADGVLTADEVLPSMEDFPVDPQGKHWAFELQMDHLAQRVSSLPKTLEPGPAIAARGEMLASSS